MQYICLYASDLENGVLKYAGNIIAVRDNEQILKRKAAENPPAYRDADSAKRPYEVWKRTYECDYATRGIFEPDVQPYQRVFGMPQKPSRDGTRGILCTPMFIYFRGTRNTLLPGHVVFICAV